ncbi:MAG: ParB/RepB/Spo0J family partition protein [Clostridia bacterium]|nr:ParB/RepB/Spo0J family partition protein [Clostridia bacterium]
MKVEEISVASCVPFSGNPFKVRDDFDMELLVQSVLDYGVMFPIMVRPLDGGKYEIVSGHRRVHACVKAGIDKIPAFIKSMSRDEAVIMMVDSNLQRESLLPSEKAFAYKLKMDALKRQGKRTDLTSDRVGPKLTAAEISDDDSATQVKRYIRLTYLIKPLLDLVDEGRIALGPAVELSYLPQAAQKSVYDYYVENEVTPSYSQTNQMKKHAAAGTLTPDTLTQILVQPKPNQVETIKIPVDFVRRFRPAGTMKEWQDFVQKACEYYAKVLRRNREKGAR